ncbi:MMPL family transporter [Halapricum hydrolyticum]|uniref:MMPL family transporter n=1 Tax=Halapricum hydrolyticum TaxID=2979991 RepID=A0AAE3IE58_9EURY|nr:MMPL family transporter [Halapricum hydrolyticum]MCU4719453.1 MMPL family transporter [Halapricum hydrolyticum]MCU4728064.1 MMPL family transporter [Halapricum hydrolyticum]
MTGDIAEMIADNARIVIAVMLVASVIVGGGVTMLDRSTSLDQFQTDADEADALDYADANFSSGPENATRAQVIVQDEDVLDRETLVAMLEYELSIRTNETINETLADENPTASVAQVLATASIRESRVEDLRDRQRELNETKTALHGTLESLVSNPNRSVRPAFESVDANSSVHLTEEDYERFNDTVRERRAANANASIDGVNGTATSDSTNETVSTGQNETDSVKNRSQDESILADEYANLSDERAAIENLEPTLDEQIEELQSLNDSQIDDLAAEALAENASQSTRALAFMPEYYEPGTSNVNATLLVVTQESPGGSFAPGDAPEAIEDAQTAIADLAPGGDSMSVLVYGDGIVSTEIRDSMIDSILLVGPLAAAFVLFVLVVVYRDPLDILLGLGGIGLVLVWTFGAMGWFDIAFSQPFIVVLVLLIGLSIDYGLHVVMRYREEREDEDTPPSEAMAVGLGSVGVALVYVTTTTVIGFLSNLTSPLSIFREIGLVSAIGIVAALLVFGVLVPALKVEFDDVLESRGFDRVKPAVGAGQGPINRILDTGSALATTAPYVVIVVAVVTSGVGVYGATEIDASFEQSDFLAEDPADWLKDLPEPIAPGTYTSETAIETLDENFVRRDTTATILVRGDVAAPGTLDRMDEARTNASDLSVTETYADGSAAVSDPITVMDDVAARNESFNETLVASDTDADGVPDRNVTAVFDELYRIAPDDASNVIHREDGTYQALRMVVTVDGDAEGETVTDQMDWIAEDIEGDGVTAIATGDVIVNQITADQLAETAILSLVVALLSVLVFLSIAYRVTEGSASLGFVTIVPVAMTLTWVLGTMALLEIPFNIVTGMITGLTIGLGVDYSLHISERFNQELDHTETAAAALHETVIGTGGALLSSAATTAAGFAVLLVAILPFLQSFGLITALTIVYAFLAAVFVLPSILIVWARFTGHEDQTTTGASETPTEPVVTRTAEEPSPMAAGNSPSLTDRVVRRTIRRRYPLPEQPIPVTVSIRGIEGRMSVREDIPGAITDVDIDPEPVAVNRNGEEITVLWELDTPETEATFSYSVELPEGVNDGDELAFDGTLRTGSDHYPIEGDEAATVVSDVCQRALEREEVTLADLQVAVERNDVSDEEFHRLRRAWLSDE